MAHIVFIQRIFREYPAFMTLSTYLQRRGHRVSVLIARGEKEPLSVIRSLNPDLAGFSPTTFDLDWCLQFAQTLKTENIPAIFGGSLVTGNHEMIHHPELDYICKGGGEYCLIRLLDLFDNRVKREVCLREIPNLVYKDNGNVVCNPLAPPIENLDALGPADHSLYQHYPQIMDSSTAIFTFMRGCKFHCTFCLNHVYQELYKNKPFIVRRKSPEVAVREIEETIRLRQRRLKIVRLFDSTLLTDSAWAMKFLELYKRRVQLPFICYAHPSEITEAFVRRLKESGCIEVGFSIESGNMKIRNKMLRKGCSDRKIYRAAKSLHDQNLPFVTFNMMGTPGEKWDDIMETIEINRKIKPLLAWSSLTQIYRGTQLEKIVKKNYAGASVSPADNALYPYAHPERQRILRLLNAFPALVRLPLLGNWLLLIDHWPQRVIAKSLFLVSFLMQLNRPALTFREFYYHYLLEKDHGVGYY